MARTQHGWHLNVRTGSVPMARSLGAGQIQTCRLARRRIFVILIRKDELFRLRVAGGASCSHKWEGISILFPFHIGPVKWSTV
jgi:hypothetical protein